MRIVFLSLALLNVVFFAWARWIDDAAQRAPVTVTDPAIPTLQWVQTGDAVATARAADVSAPSAADASSAPAMETADPGVPPAPH